MEKCAKSRWGILLLVAVLLLGACGHQEKSVPDETVKKARFDQASKRAEIGSVFYTDDHQAGIFIEPVGTFIYDLDQGQLTHGFWVDWSAILGADQVSNYYTMPFMDKDKKTVYLQAVHWDENRPFPKVIKIDLADDKSYLIEMSKEELDDKVLPNEWTELSFDNNTDWLKLENLYFMKGEEKIYPFKNMN